MQNSSIIQTPQRTPANDYKDRVKRLVRNDRNEIQLADVTEAEEKEIMDAIYAVEASIKRQLEDARGTNTSGRRITVPLKGMGSLLKGTGSLLNGMGRLFGSVGMKLFDGLTGTMHGMLVGLYGLRGPTASLLKTVLKIGIGAVSRIPMPSPPAGGSEIHPSQFALPEEMASSPAALQGAYIGLATATSVRWMSMNSARLALYALAAVMLVLLITGIVLYYRDYQQYEQAKKEQALGVVSADTRKVRREMERRRGENKPVTVRYVEMTPLDYTHMQR